MKISGIQKLTLLDYPGKLAATIFTHGCDFRCPFCHNPELVTEDFDKKTALSESDILEFLKTRNGKLDALVITGGEPLIQSDIADFIKKVKKLGFLVKVDTNGSFPNALEKLIAEEIVDFWAMDVKASEKNYENAAGTKVDYQKIKRSIKLIVDSGADYEFRTTVVKGIHTSKDIEEIGSILKGTKSFAIQNFNPGKTLDPGFDKENSFSDPTLKDFKKIMQTYVQEVTVR